MVANWRGMYIFSNWIQAAGLLGLICLWITPFNKDIISSLTSFRTDAWFSSNMNMCCLWTQYVWAFGLMQGQNNWSKEVRLGFVQIWGALGYLTITNIMISLLLWSHLNQCLDENVKEHVSGTLFPVFSIIGFQMSSSQLQGFRAIDGEAPVMLSQPTLAPPFNYLPQPLRKCGEDFMCLI